MFDLCPGSCDRGAITHSGVIFQDPKQIVSCIDFRYITDALTEEEALGEAALGSKSLIFVKRNSCSFFLIQTYF